MASSMSEIDLRYTDKRTAERYIKQGLLDEKAYEKHIKTLPDVTENSVRVQAEAEEYILDDEHPEVDE